MAATTTQRQSHSKVADRRRACGLTQSQLASRVGVTSQSIYYYERGDFKPSPKTAEALAAALDCDIADIQDGCEFCGGDASRELFTHIVCERCTERFFAIGESMCSDGAATCEVCGAEATAIVDGHVLCKLHHGAVARMVEKSVTTLQWLPQVDQLRALPEAETK
jgi:DNA-binding XRE family transcriptional regulator